MRKWRPCHRCMYIIPEIHGNIDSFNIIVNRIFPLRFSNKEFDQVILLGDFIDKGFDSSKVLDLIINLQKEYKENFICIKGNHEQLLLNALNSENGFNSWLSSGGQQTISSYLEALKLKSDPAQLPFSRLKDIIPAHHIEFLSSLKNYHQNDDYIFFHGGLNNNLVIEETSAETLLSDFTFSKNVKKILKNKEQLSLPFTKICVGAHNYKSTIPFIYSKYLMLGGSAPNKLVLFELNSMSCAIVKKGKSRIYKHKFKFFE